MPKLVYTLDLNASRASLWDFYNTLAVLPQITPPGTRVTIPNPPDKLAAGVRFTLWVSQPPIPVALPWECVFTTFEPQRLFVDEQDKGPFALWRHEHCFDALPDGGSRLTDRITYEAPFGPFGRIADALFLRRTLDRMFAYRHQETRRLLDGKK